MHYLGVSDPLLSFRRAACLEQALEEELWALPDIVVVRKTVGWTASKPRSPSSSPLSCAEGIKLALMSRVGSKNCVLAVVRCLARRRLLSRPHSLLVVAIVTSASANLDTRPSAKRWTAV